MNLVNNYKTKHKMFIFFIIRRSKTIITIFEISVLRSLVDIIVSILSLKKRDRSFKIVENASMSKKKDKLLKIKIVINKKKDNNVKTLS